MDEKEHVFTFYFNREGSKEHLSLETTWRDSGDGNGVDCVIQELTLDTSHGSVVALKLTGPLFTPELLRQLADELEKEGKKANSPPMETFFRR